MWNRCRNRFKSCLNQLFKKSDGQEETLPWVKEFTNMHPELINTDGKNKKTLLEDDNSFVADECPSSNKTLNEQLKSLDESAERRTNENKNRTTIEVPLTNGLPKDDSSMKFDILKIALDPIPVIENGSSEMNAKYPQPDDGDETNDANAGRPYACYICGKEFSRNSSLKCHIRLHLEGPVSLQRARFLKEASMPTDKDEESEYEEPTLKCDHCDRAFHTRRAKNIHTAHVHRLNGNVSEANGFDGASTYQHSVKDGESEDEECSLKCEHCDRMFHTRRAKNIHIAHGHKMNGDLSEANDLDDCLADDDSIDDAEELFECVHCGKRFKSRRAMNIHRAHTHRGERDEEPDERATFSEDDDEEFECEYCGRVFRSKRARSIHAVSAHRLNAKQLNAHRKEREVESEERSASSVDDDEEFECDYCGRAFRSQRARSIHAVSAHGLDSEQLGRMNGTYREEREDETDERAAFSEDDEEFECDYCGRAFRSQRARSIHAVSAHGLDSEQLGRMNGTHREEREDGSNERATFSEGDEEFECNYCGRGFRSQRARSIHAVSAHGLDSEQLEKMNNTNAFECTVCERKFTTFKAYDAHSEGVCGTAQILNGSYVYVCQKCPKTFTHPKSMSRHFRVHREAVDDESESDDEVNSEIASPVKTRPVVEKQRSKDKHKIYVCKYCGRTFPASVGYAGHMKAHKAEIAADAALNASRVTQTFAPSIAQPAGERMRQHTASNEKMYDSRRANVVEDKVYKCDACTQTFTYLSELKRHTTKRCNRKRSFNSRNVNDLLKCEYCEQTFLLRCHLQKHMKSRCNANDLGSESAEEFVNGDLNDAPPNKRIRKSTLRDSMYEYEPMIKSRRSAQKSAVHDRAIECEYCDKCFDNEERLFDHLRAHVDAEELTDEYVENDIEFPASEQFVIQNLNGDEEGFVFEQYDDSQGYQCNECDETFRDKLQMIIHMSFHFSNRLPNDDCKSLTIKADATLIAPYKCPFCEERFVNTKYRKRHLCKRHSDDIFKCDVCEKLFLYKQTLKRHCQQHMIETKHHCEYCLKCFTSKWFLKRHTRRHCEKRLALEELNQSAQMDALSADVHSDIIDINFVDNFDELVKEEVYID